MADETPNRNSLAFSALAYGIFEGAKDVNSGRDALLEAYQSSSWDNPAEAQKDLEYYGNALKYKFQDQTPFAPDTLEAESPVPINLVPREPDESEQTVYSRWEDLNQKYLEETKDPQFLVAKNQWKQDIKDYASLKRRALNAQEEDKITEKTPGILKPIAKFNQAFKDIENRAIRGASAVVEPIVNFVANRIPGVDNYELNSHLTEHIDPRNDDKFLYQVAEGAGSGAAIAGAFAVSPVLGAGALGVQAADAISTRYTETKQRTGDEAKAFNAAAIETGSQALQTLGETLIFGKLGKVLGGKTVAKEAETLAEKSLVGEVAKAGSTGAVTTAGGQAISQQAEDIERHTDTSAGETFDKAFQAGAVGGLVSAGAGAISNRAATRPNNANTSIRAKEIAQDGYPTTPVTKQVVGQLAPSKEANTQVIAAPSEVDSIVLSSPEQLAPQENTGTQDVGAATQKVGATPVFTTEDGSKYSITDDGYYVPQKDGVTADPHDSTLFLDESNAQKVAKAIVNGDNVILGEKGVLAIEHAKEGEATTYEEVPASDTPTEGSYALGVSKERSPSSQLKERLVDIPRKITSVDRSVGAASRGSLGEEETAYSRKVAQNPLMQQALMDATGFDKLYPGAGRDSLTAMDLRVQQYVEQNGIEGAVRLIQGGDPETLQTDPSLFKRMQVFLHNFIAAEQASGDPARIEKANSLFVNIAQNLSDVGTEAGQGLGALRGKTPTEVIERQAKAYNTAFDTEVTKISQEENVTPEEVKQIDKVVEVSDTEVKAVENTLKQLTDIEKVPEVIDAKQELENIQAEKKSNPQQVTKAKEKLIKAKETAKETLNSKNNTEVQKVTEKLKEIKLKNNKVKKIQERKKLAQQLAAEAAAAQSKVEQQLSAVNGALKDQKLVGILKNNAEMHRTALEAIADPTNKPKNDALMGIWSANLVGSITQPVLGILNGGLIIPAVNIAKMSVTSIPAVLKNISQPEFARKIPLLHYLSGLVDKDSLVRSGKLAKTAFVEGKRVTNILPSNEIQANTGLARTSDPQDIRVRIHDYLNYLKSLDPKGKSLPKQVGINLLKLGGYPAGVFLRSLSAVEAIVYGQQYSGYSNYVKALEYNRGLAEGKTPEQLTQYTDRLADQWKYAQQKAETEVNALQETYKKAGITGPELTKGDKLIRSVEILQQMQPHEVALPAYKLAAETVLNGPAGGHAGLVSSWLGAFAEQIPGGRYIIAPFANSIAHFINQNIAVTPFGLVDLRTKANLTPAEKNLRIAGAISGMTIASALAIAAKENLKKDEKDRLWDIYGSFSSDPKKVAAFEASGGKRFSIRIGNTYVQWGESPLAMLLGGVTSVVDRTRDGKTSEEANAVSMMYAAFSAVTASAGTLGNISMLRGISELSSALLGAAKSPDEKQLIAVTRSLISTVKGFVPSASVLRTISRYTDTPTDAKKDIQSALVEGIPGLQSAFGKPALNVFGEPMRKQGDLLSLHRIFSTKADDLDIRWLVDNGYTTPGMDAIRFSEREQALTGKKSPEYDLKHAAFMDSSVDIRDTVRSFRERYGPSAYRKAVQKALNERINAIIARNVAKRLQETSLPK